MGRSLCISLPRLSAEILRNRAKPVPVYTARSRYMIEPAEEDGRRIGNVEFEP
jgi:hypothetical protein